MVDRAQNSPEQSAEVVDGARKPGEGLSKEGNEQALPPGEREAKLNGISKLEPDIPKELLEPTAESVVKYNQELATRVESRLRKDPDHKEQRLPSADDEPATRLDIELQGLSNAELADRLHRVMYDQEQRKELEAAWRKTAEQELVQSKQLVDLYRFLSRENASPAEREMAAQLRADFKDPEKNAEMMEHFQDQVMDKYHKLLTDPSGPLFSEQSAKFAEGWRNNFEDPEQRAAVFAKEGGDWPGKDRNCCCKNDRNKAIGMITWVEGGRRAQNAACHGTNLIRYFPPKMSRVKLDSN